MHTIIWESEIQRYYPLAVIKADSVLINKKKTTVRKVDFDISGVHILKIKESEKEHWNIDLAPELIQLWNMRKRLYQLYLVRL